MNQSKRRKLPTRGVRPALQPAIQPLQLHHVGALHACYEEHVWPRIRDSVLMPTCEQLGTRVHHEVELGAVISSTPVAKLSAGQLPVPTPSPSSLLSGFIRKLQTSERSALGHLMPTALCHAAQCLIKLLPERTVGQKARFCLDPVVVWEESASYRIQHVNTSYILTQRRRTKLNPITQQCSPTQTEWKCKYLVEMPGIEQHVQIAREAHFDDTNQDHQRHAPPPPHGGGAQDHKSQRLDHAQGQTLLQSSISLGLVDMRTDDPHIVEPLSEGNRVLFVWSIPPEQTGHRWGIDIRLILDASSTLCTPSRIMQCLRSARGSNSVSMDMITRAIGATLCQWRVELEYDEIITTHDFSHGYAVFAAFVRMATRQIDGERFAMLLQDAVSGEMGTIYNQYAHYQIVVRVLANFLDYRIQWITTAAASDLMPVIATFLWDAPTHCWTVPQQKNEDIITVPYPRQPRPRDITRQALQNLAVGHAVVTAKLDGAEAFLLGTVYGTLLIARGGWLMYTPWGGAAPVPTPFILEGEFLPQSRIMSCYDGLVLPSGDITEFTYRYRLARLGNFLRMHGPAINATLSYTVDTKPFFDHSAFAALAVIQCFQWMQRVKLPADGFVLSCGLRTYWKQFAVKSKFAPSIDFLLQSHPELPVGHFQMMLRDRRGKDTIYCSIEHDKSLPLVARVPAGDEGLYAQRVIEALPIRQSTDPLVWDFRIGPLRERNKQPNYVANAHLLLQEMESAHGTAVQQVFGQQVIGDTIKIVQKHKWNHVAGSIDSTWKLFRSAFNCTQFAVVEVGGGNGGDLHKWLALALQHPLRCVHVVEPDAAAQAVYYSRLLGLQKGQYTVATASPALVCITHKGSQAATTFHLHNCTLDSWNPPEPPPQTTGVCVVFNFSLAQIITSLDDFGDILRSLLRRPMDHIVGVLHSYGREVETTRQWSNGLSWGVPMRRHAIPRTTLTVHGSRLASDITEAMVDAQHLVQEARECGFSMYAEALCSVVGKPLHWLLGSLYGFSIFHPTTMGVTMLRHVMPVPQDIAQTARDFALTLLNPNHRRMVIVIVGAHLLVYTIPGVALLRYLGQIQACGPVGTPLRSSPRMLFVITPGGSQWLVACDDGCEQSGVHHSLLSNVGFTVQCQQLSP
jgi:hypothetical protein